MRNVNNNILQYIVLLPLLFVMTAFELTQNDAVPLSRLEPITADNVARLEQLTVLTGAYRHIVFNPDGKMLASVNEYGGNEINLWNMETGDLTILKGNDFLDEWDLEFSPDGVILASANWNNIELWSVEMSKQLTVLENTVVVK